jgi:hypothetical protein
MLAVDNVDEIGPDSAMRGVLARHENGVEVLWRHRPR